ncbi:MAG: cobalamin-dependent protein [Dongiaceae bacterium]
MGQIAEQYARGSSRETPAGGRGGIGDGSIRSGEGRDQARLQLARAIEVEIIPRLVLAGRAGQPEPQRQREPLVLRPAPEEVAEFSGIVLGQDAGDAAAYVQGLQDRGATIETLFLDLLAPAARRLGELWSADLVDFVEVTIGLGRLQQVLREFTPAFQRDAVLRSRSRRLLIVPTIGEQHTFGLIMVAEFFRRAGWGVWRSFGPSSELVDVVRQEWFSVVGFSAGSETRLDALASEIRAVRRASCNRAVGVMVGGPVFVAHPEFVPLVGADTMANDGRDAPRQAEDLIRLLARMG